MLPHGRRVQADELDKGWIRQRRERSWGLVQERAREKQSMSQCVGHLGGSGLAEQREQILLEWSTLVW